MMTSVTSSILCGRGHQQVKFSLRWTVSLWGTIALDLHFDSCKTFSQSSLSFWGVAIVPACFLSSAPCTSDIFSDSQYLPKTHEYVLDTMSYHSIEMIGSILLAAKYHHSSHLALIPVHLLVTWFLNYNDVQHHKISPPAVSYLATVYHEA